MKNIFFLGKRVFVFPLFGNFLLSPVRMLVAGGIMGSSQEGEEREGRRVSAFLPSFSGSPKAPRRRTKRGFTKKKLKQASISDKKNFAKYFKKLFLCICFKKMFFVVSNPVLYLPVFSLPSPVSPSPHGAFPPPLLFYAISFPLPHFCFRQGEGGLLKFKFRPITSLREKRRRRCP